MADQSLPQESIFLQAMEIPSVADRAAYLDRACGNDRTLRAEVESLLHAHDRSGDLLDLPERRVATLYEPILERPGTVIGPYKLLEQIGEGGFGVVFMAEQQSPVRRKVALKVIKPGMDTSQVIARFEAERQALALMEHPNIARVLDAGTTGESEPRTQRSGVSGGPAESPGAPPLTPLRCVRGSDSVGGRPYFVMELVRGTSMTEYCDQHNLPVRERLELFVDVCQAVQHAHQKGIIHRDIKPSNVLVTLHDGKPVVKVIDFGIAKAIGQERLTEKTVFTNFAQMIGTPMYMSPEQAEMSAVDADTRSDIYSLGVLLYELLTGTTPFDKERLKQAGFDDIRRIIREEEPPKPSTRMSQVEHSLRECGRTRGASAPHHETVGQAASTASEKRQSDPRTLSRLFRGELDWIVMKALEKDRNRRYETASAFAADVGRYLQDEAVLACPPSAVYRFRKFARRHKAALGIAAAATLVLFLAASGVSWALWDQTARRTELSERMAETERTVSAALIQTEQWGKQAEVAPSATSKEADAGLALWRQAEASLAQAETALRTGTADDRLRQQVSDLQERIERGRAKAQRTATLLRDLDDARMTTSIWTDSHFDYAGGATKYAAAFAAYGLEVTSGQTEDLARRIRAEEPAIREALIVALDYWWGTATRAKTVELANLVRALAAAADDDPWRRQFRAAAADKDAAALRALSAEARRLSLPPSSLELLAASLRSLGERDEALALLRWARGRHLTDFWIHIELGSLLDEGDHKSPLILEEAIGSYRTALALRLGASAVHNNLGICLRAQNQLDDAIAEYRWAIDLDGTNRNAHYNLGNALQAKNQLDEAIAEFRQAIGIDSKYAPAHYGLGNALATKNQLDEAVAQYREAIAIDPKYAMAHYGLGNALQAKNQLDEACAEYRQAIDLDPDFAEAHCNLALILRSQGQLSASLDSYRRGHALGSKRGDWRYPSERWVADAERLVRCEAKLPDVVAGKAAPTDNRERIELLFVCRVQRRHVSAARLYADAFTADPKLADDLKGGLRYTAACSAALAAAGQGTDADKPDVQEQSRLRQQALVWLRADLEQWSKRLEDGKPEDRQVVRAKLEHWQRDTDLAGVRDLEALKKLSDDEQAAWRKLWADVAELLKKAGDVK